MYQPGMGPVMNRGPPAAQAPRYPMQQQPASYVGGMPGAMPQQQIQQQMPYRGQMQPQQMQQQIPFGQAPYPAPQMQQAPYQAGVAPYQAGMGRPPMMQNTPAATTPIGFPPAAGGMTGVRKSGIILCIGDSLTAGISQVKDAYINTVEDRLREQGFNGFVYKNAGVYGEKTDAVMRRVPQVIADIKRSGIPVAFVFILAGTNDLFQYSPPDQLLRQLKGMQDMLDGALGSPCIGVLTVPTSVRFNAGQEDARLKLNEALQQICAQSPPHKRLLVDIGTVPVELSSDGIHYSGPGYVEFGERVFAAMQPLLAA